MLIKKEKDQSDSMGKGNTCILFMAHHLNSFILKEFDNLCECRRFDYDVRLLYDNSKNDFPFKKFKDEKEYALFTRADMEKAYPMVPFWKDKRNPFYGNLLFPILSFAGNTSYDYIWRIEFDVRFSGRWQDFFNAFASSPADLLGTTLGTFNRSPSWNWWQTATLNGVPVATDKLIRGFYPVLRLSRQACAVLEAAYRQGWQGHFEVLLATILQQQHCRIEDIGGNGEFVQPANRNRFYSNTPQHSNLWPGTFVWRMPDACRDHRMELPNYLYHPVMKKSAVRRIYCLFQRMPRCLANPTTNFFKRIGGQRLIRRF